jgi:hypothetical protein
MMHSLSELPSGPSANDGRTVRLQYHAALAPWWKSRRVRWTAAAAVGFVVAVFGVGPLRQRLAPKPTSRPPSRLARDCDIAEAFRGQEVEVNGGDSGALDDRSVQYERQFDYTLIYADGRSGLKDATDSIDAWVATLVRVRQVSDEPLACGIRRTIEYETGPTKGTMTYTLTSARDAGGREGLELKGQLNERPNRVRHAPALLNPGNCEADRTRGGEATSDAHAPSLASGIGASRRLRLPFPRGSVRVGRQRRPTVRVKG